MILPLLLHNSELRPSSELLLSPGQAGFMNGWGVFSTIKVVEGVLFAFDRHWARMRRDADLMRVPFPWTPDELEPLLLRLVEANQDLDCTLRVAAVRNSGTSFDGPPVGRDVDLVAFLSPRMNWGGAVRLGVVPNARYAANVFAGTKITSWAMNLVWYEEAHQQGLDEVILLNERGEVSECTSANIFLVSGNTIVTPPLASGCLPGVTRELLLEQVHVPGLEMMERTVLVDDLEAADGVFITSSTRDLLPVSHIEGLAVRHEDRVRIALASAFAAYESSYVAGAARRALVGKT